MTEPLRVGVVGTGMIAASPHGYLAGLAHIPEKVQVVGIADQLVDRAKAVAEQYDIPRAYGDLDDLLAQDDVDAVLNLTNIAAHGALSRRILEAGKHLLSEKPISITMDDADAIVELAAKNNLTAVVAPMNAINPVLQEARRLIDADAIGKIALAKVRSSHAGPGGFRIMPWPGDPSWFYQEGAGPLYDMGVYGIHTITALLGPAKRIMAFSGITDPKRAVRGGPFDGLEFDVTEDDNNLIMLDFGGSTFAVVDGTYNVHASRGPAVEVFGRSGVISMPYFEATGVFANGVPLELFRADAAPGLDGWITPTGGPGGMEYLSGALERAQQLSFAYSVEHLADSIAAGTPSILSPEHARHALEIMLRVKESSRRGEAIELTTTF